MTLHRTTLLAAALLAGAAPAAAQTDPRDYSLIQSVPRAAADRWLKEEVLKSGRDFERERYHFIVGFSTGHYGSDPVHAIAMRRLAFALLNNTFTAGDRVTAAGWEMALWKEGKAIPLTADPASRAAFVDDVPYAPKAGSLGGHDTERAMYDTLTRVVEPQHARSTIILLLTNTNQSQGPTGVRAALFGANNPRLVAALRRLGYRAPVRQSFGARSRDRFLTIDLTALFPRRLASLPGAPATPRYPTFPPESWQPPADRPQPSEPLPNPTIVITVQPPPAPPPAPVRAPAPAPERKPFPWDLLAAAAAAALALVALVWWLRNRPPAPPKKEEPAAPPAKKGRPLPGSVGVVVGTAPREARTTLKPLTTAGRWAVVREGEGAKLVEEEAAADVSPLARVGLDERGRLRVDAEADTVFTELKGINVAASSNRQLLLAPGDRLVCRLVAPGGEPVRLELVYQRS